MKTVLDNEYPCVYDHERLERILGYKVPELKLFGEKILARIITDTSKEGRERKISFLENGLHWLAVLEGKAFQAGVERERARLKKRSDDLFGW